MEYTGYYYSTVSGESFGCHIKIVNEKLYIHLNDEKRSMVTWNFTGIVSCKFTDTILRVTHQDNPYILECSGEMAVRIYNAWTKKEEVPGDKKSKNLRLVSIALFCVGFCLFLWFLFIPWLGEISAALVPEDLEISLGETLSETIASESDINDSAGYYINKFAMQLNADDTYPLKVQVINSDEVNAFALPGGKIFVYSAIIDKMTSYEELVALLGHEISHVTNRHSLKSICRSAASSIVLSMFFGNTGGISSGIIGQVNQFKSLDYSRDLETEADNSGLQFMVNNEVNPAGMLGLLKLLKEVSMEEPGLMKYLSTHPDTDSRITNISSNPNTKKNFSGKYKTAGAFYKAKTVYLRRNYLQLPHFKNPPKLIIFAP